MSSFAPGGSPVPPAPPDSAAHRRGDARRCPAPADCDTEVMSHEVAADSRSAPPDGRDELARPAVDVAPVLLGAIVRSHTVDGAVAVRLTEVEAYMGAEDPGSHAYRGRTDRNAIMFGPAGHLYVYFTYGKN